MAEPPEQEYARTRFRRSAAVSAPIPSINRMIGAEFLANPWLWTRALVTIALGGWGWGGLAGLLQGWCVLFVLLVNKQEGQLPAICLIGLMSLGSLPFTNVTFSLDLGLRLLRS